MKTLKKLFSVSAIVALLGTLAPMYAFGAGNSLDLDPEFPQAYAYAYANGITTQSEENVDMGGKLTRIAMAKMIAKYAINVLKLTPDTSKTCTFTDVTAALDAQYDNWVTQACQLGLMWVNITAFRPNDLVTRGEFGTTLSRALNANSDELATMNAATPYYKEHLKYLNETKGANGKSIMGYITDPDMLEVRGYVMLMMMRSDENYTAVEGCTAEELLACFNADDYDACIAACSDEEPAEEEPTDPEEVKAGTLNVTMKSEEGGELPSLMSSLPVVTYTLKATDEDVNITSLVIEEGWYAKASSLSAALFIDGQRVSKVKPLTNLNTKYTVSLNSAYTVKAWKSVDIELRVNHTANKDQQFNIKLDEVNSSAEKVKLPSNVTSNTFKLLSTETDTLTVSATSALESPKAGTKAADLFEIKLAWNAKQDVEFNSIMLVANDKEVAEDLENVELVLDNEVLAEWKLNGKYLTFNLKNAYTIEKSKTATFTVRADVVGWAGKTFNYKLESVMDLSATAVSYNAPVKVVNTPTFSDFTISAGRVVIERTNPSSNTFSKNRTNLYLGSFTITDNNKGNLTLNSFDIAFYNNTDTLLDVSDFVSNVKVRYGSNTAWLVETSTETVTNKAKFDDEQAINGKLTVYVYADIDDVPVLWKSFHARAIDFDITEDENNEDVTDISPANSWMTMIWSDSSLTLTNQKPADDTYAKWTADIDAVSFKVKTNATEWVKIKRLIFNGTDASTVLGVAEHTYDTDAEATAAAAEINKWADYEAVATAKKVEITQLVAKDTVDAGETFKVNGDNYEVTIKWVAWALNSNTIKSAKLYVWNKPYDATISANQIRVTSPITLDADTTTTFTLKVDLTSNPTVSPFVYSLVSYEAEDTSADRNDLSVGFVDTIVWWEIEISSEWILAISTKSSAEVNKYNKSILAGNSGNVVEYTLKATYEDLMVTNGEVELTFWWAALDADTLSRINDIQLIYNDEVVASDPIVTTTKATFNNVNFNINEGEAPLLVKVITKKITTATEKTLKNVTIASIAMDGVYWKSTGNPVTPNTTAVSASKAFSIVPSIVTPSVKDKTASKTTLVFAVDNWDNTVWNAAVELTLDNLVLDINSNANGLDSILIKNSSNETIVSTKDACVAEDDEKQLTVTATNFAKKLCLHTDKDLSIADGTELTISYLVWSAANPSFTVDLTDAVVDTSYTNIKDLSIGMTRALTLIEKN